MPSDSPSRSPLLWPALVAAAAAAAHLAVALRGDRFVATAGEARLAAATFAARGTELGDIALPAPDRFAVRQFAVMETLLPTGNLPGRRRRPLRGPRASGSCPSSCLARPARPRRRPGARRGRDRPDRGAAPGRHPARGDHRRPRRPRCGWWPRRRWPRWPAGVGRAAAVAAGLAALTAPLAAAACSPSPRTSCTTGCWAAAARRGPAADHRRDWARRPCRRGHGGRATARSPASAARSWAWDHGHVVVAGDRARLVRLVAASRAAARAEPALLLLAVAVVPGAARSAALLLVLPFLAVVFALLAEPVVASPSRSAAPGRDRPPADRARAGLGVGLLAVVNVAPTRRRTWRGG